MFKLFGILLVLALAASVQSAAAEELGEDGFADSDGVKIHYVTAGKGPLVVLIGPASASAAEVTAAALRNHRRALLVGGESAGAVLLSQAYPLPDGGKVTVAIADVLTPDGRRLEGVGVSPDLPVAQTLAAVRADRDLPLEAAEKALLDGRWRP